MYCLNMLVNYSIFYAFMFFKYYIYTYNMENHTICTSKPTYEIKRNGDVATEMYLEHLDNIDSKKDDNFVKQLSKSAIESVTFETTNYKCTYHNCQSCDMFHEFNTNDIEKESSDLVLWYELSGFKLNENCILKKTKLN